MDRCSCTGPGHCPTFNKTMTARMFQICSGICPPDVRPVPNHIRTAYWNKWASSPSAPKALSLPLTPGFADPRWSNLKTLRPPVANNHFVTTAQLAEDAVRLAGVAPADVDVVVGIARSGLIPAAAISSILHVPLYAVGLGGEVTEVDHGVRMNGHAKAEPRHILLVDDTVGTGRAMKAAATAVGSLFPSAALTRATVYVHPQSAGAVDLAAAFYPGKHYLQWSWQNAGHGGVCGFDFDGILCQECPSGSDDDGPLYREFLVNARPLYLPRRKPVPLVVTARHEKYRPLTEDWLRRHGVQVEKLIMRNWNFSGARVQAIAEWKADIFYRSTIRIVAESEPIQAEIINRITGLAVICPAMGRVLPPSSKPAILREVCIYQGAEVPGCKTCGGEASIIRWCESSDDEADRCIRGRSRDPSIRSCLTCDYHSPAALLSVSLPRR